MLTFEHNESLIFRKTHKQMWNVNFVTDLQMKAYRGSRCITPLMLRHCTRWSWVVKFMSRTLYRQERTPKCKSNRGLGGPHWRSGRFGEKRFLPPPRIEPWVIYLNSCHYTDWASNTYWEGGEREKREREKERERHRERERERERVENFGSET